MLINFDYYMIRNNIISLFFIILLSCSSDAFAISNSSDNKNALRAAVVDIHLVFEKSLAVQNMQKEISRIGEDLEKVMHAKEMELKKDEEDIMKKRGVLSDTEFEKEVSKFNKKLSDTQNMMQEKKTRLDRAYSNGMQQAHDTTIDIIKSLTKEHDFNIVFPSSPLLYYSQGLDITEIVISRLNDTLKTIPFNY